MPAPTDRLRQLYLLTGVFPVGLFVLGHVTTQLRVLAGPAAYERSEVGIRALRVWPLIEGVVLLSLAFHIAYGVTRFLTGAGHARAPRASEPMRFVERAAGGAALAFLAWHLVALRVERGGMTPAAMHAALVASLSSTTAGVPLVALGYLVGIAACSFHFASLVATFVASSRVAWSPGARRATSVACAALGAALFLAGADATVHLATGARHFWR